MRMYAHNEILNAFCFEGKSHVHAKMQRHQDTNMVVNMVTLFYILLRPFADFDA